MTALCVLLFFIIYSLYELHSFAYLTMVERFFKNNTFEFIYKTELNQNGHYSEKKKE